MRKYNKYLALLILILIWASVIEMIFTGWILDNPIKSVIFIPFLVYMSNWSYKEVVKNNKKVK